MIININYVNEHSEDVAKSHETGNAAFGNMITSQRRSAKKNNFHNFFLLIPAFLDCKQLYCNILFTKPVLSLQC